jgi:hypothetical protein
MEGPESSIGRRWSFKPFLYMFLGAIVGFVAGALGHSFVLTVIGRLLPLWNTGIRTMGDIPVVVGGLAAPLAQGVVMFGAVKGYWTDLEKSLGIGGLELIGMLVSIGVLMWISVAVVLRGNFR